MTRPDSGRGTAFTSTRTATRPTVGSTRCPVDVDQHLRGVAARLPQTRAALEYAERKHAGQRRGDGTAFIEHPTEVGWLLYRNGARDHVIAAGVLHDVLEKTSVSVGELDARFGSDIARLVSAVSEDVRIEGYEARKAALRQRAAAAGPEALTVFAADKISKMRELRAAIATASPHHERVDESLVPSRRLAHLRHCLGMLEEQLGDSPLVQLLRTELGELDDDLRGSVATRRSVTRRDGVSGASGSLKGSEGPNSSVSGDGSTKRLLDEPVR
jgi:(p)ppGpp synthase/HD superfamily hydrolase